MFLIQITFYGCEAADSFDNCFQKSYSRVYDRYIMNVVQLLQLRHHVHVYVF